MVWDSEFDCSREAGFTKIGHGILDSDKKSKWDVERSGKVGLEPPLPDPGILQNVQMQQLYDLETELASHLHSQLLTKWQGCDINRPQTQSEGAQALSFFFTHPQALSRLHHSAKSSQGGMNPILDLMGMLVINFRG